MKILEANERESSAFTGTEYLPFSDSADSTDGRVSTANLKEYISEDLQTQIDENAAAIEAITSVSDEDIEEIFE